MKRRNADCAKLRRPLKRGKITEGVYGSTFLYLKFLMVWALVLVADFILELRFEYLWPFWLMLRSVYDSYKYQGLAFSVFFVCIAITSDVICYLFIPVQWLFFAASTYVWVQYVWHTERGICLPTLSLWLLFVYIEASVRLRELRTLPFNLDLCRPFAAHCIGYPVVTLGFGFKSYISYKMRVRKQKDVQKENEFHIQLLQQALPPEQQNVQNTEKVKALTSKSQEEVISNGAPPVAGKKSSASHERGDKSSPSAKAAAEQTEPAGGGGAGGKDWKKPQANSHIEDFEFIEQSIPRHSVNDFTEADENDATVASKTFKNAVNTKTTAKLNCARDQPGAVGAAGTPACGKRGKSNIMRDSTANNVQNNKDDYISRLESDVKRFKLDLQASRNTEQDLRSQINNLIINDKATRNELYQLRQDNESLQTKLHNLVTSRQQDKQNLVALEKKLQEERKTKACLEQQISQERKAKKAEEQATARAVAMAAATRGECTDLCKVRRRDLENDCKLVRRDLKIREDQIRHMEIEAQSLHQYKEAQNDTDVLMSALAAMQDKNTHLENSLSAETRLKLDLFSALGEAKRQIEIHQEITAQKDRVISDLKSKYAELMCLLPSNVTMPNGTCVSTTDPVFTTRFTPINDASVLLKSTLNPNASDYTPKLNH